MSRNAPEPAERRSGWNLCSRNAVPVSQWANNCLRERRSAGRTKFGGSATKQNNRSHRSPHITTAAARGRQLTTHSDHSADILIIMSSSSSSSSSTLLKFSKL